VPWRRRGLAEDPDTPAWVLVELARDRSKGVRLEVAWNESTPAGTLVALAGDEDTEVRAAVLENPSAPDEAVEAATAGRGDDDAEL
jgi:hypothetical protein